ncbi:MAG: ABC transporter permease subunit [Gammaproteobacteria bacterium]|nr:ABC transporter permease subunit [Gammaproteobacteria bacterium]
MSDLDREMGTFLILLRNKIRNVPISIAALLALLPLVPVALWSVSGSWRFPALWPEAWSLRGFRHLAEPGTRFAEALATSLGIAVAVTAASIVVALPAGIAIGAHRFRLRNLVILIVLLPILVPPLAVTLGIHGAFIQLGLADTAVGVILVHLVPAVPYAVLILASVFASRSGEIEATARTLGAAPWQAFLHVTLPQIAPGLAVAALLAFLISWSQYILTVIIGGGSVLTLAMLLFSAASGNDPVVTGALAVVFALPAVTALLLVLRLLRPRVDRAPALDRVRWAPGSN